MLSFQCNFFFLFAQFFFLAFSCEATPLPTSDGASGLLSSSFREENTIIGQVQMQSTTTATSNTGIITTTDLFTTEGSQFSAEIGTEQSTNTTERQTVESSEINEISADNDKTNDGEGTQIDASSKTNTSKNKYLHSVISIFRLLAKALKAAPHFLG